MPNSPHLVGTWLRFFGSKVELGTTFLSYRVLFGFCERKKDSKWIYSSKYDELQSVKKGKIFITTDSGENSHDVTLRMYRAYMEDSEIIFSQDPPKTNSLLEALHLKRKGLAFREGQGQGSESSDKMSLAKVSPEGTALAENSLSQRQESSYQNAIELSKHLDMEVDVEHTLRTNKDPSYKLLARKQEELRVYLKNREFWGELQRIKDVRGYPQVLSLLSKPQDIRFLRENGFNVTYVLNQFQVQSSKTLFENLESLKVPYEILPSKNDLINTIVASGFPADRFAIEYFPEDLEGTLNRRKVSKLTVAMVVKAGKLQQAIEAITSVYGREQKVFLPSSGMPFRAEISKFYDFLSEKPIRQTQSIKLIVSPYISQFNEELREGKDEISHIYGQAQSEKTNFIDLEILGDKLEELQSKQHTYQVDLYTMAAEMLQRLSDEQVVRSTFRKMLGANDSQVSRLIEEGKKRIAVDYVGLHEFRKKTR